MAEGWRVVSWTHDDVKALLSAAFYGGAVVAEWQSVGDVERFLLTAGPFSGVAEPCVLIEIGVEELAGLDRVVRGGVIRGKVKAGVEALAARVKIGMMQAAVG